jgi:hypothetical protein
MKQKKRRPLAGLRGVDGAVGEKSVHAALSFKVGMPIRQASSAPIDKSNFSLFKPLVLDVIFHACKIRGRYQGNFDAFAR